MCFDAVVVRMKPQRPDGKILRGMELKHLPRGGKQHRGSIKTMVHEVNPKATVTGKEENAIQRSWPGGAQAGNLLFFDGALDGIVGFAIHDGVAWLQEYDPSA